jgi:hypothetical protein
MQALSSRPRISTTGQQRANTPRRAAIKASAMTATSIYGFTAKTLEGVFGRVSLGGIVGFAVARVARVRA